MTDVLDLADQAEAAEQRFRDAALSVRKPTLVPCGRCHFCDEPVPPGALFCPINPRFPAESCAADWQRDQDARKRNGE